MTVRKPGEHRLEHTPRLLPSSLSFIEFTEAGRSFQFVKFGFMFLSDGDCSAKALFCLSEGSIGIFGLEYEEVAFQSPELRMKTLIGVFTRNGEERCGTRLGFQNGRSST